MKNMLNNLGKVVGGTLFVGATAAIWLLPNPESPAPEPEPVRPVRSEIVAEAHKMPDLHLAGVVCAEDSRNLTFREAGRVEKIPAKKGDLVKKGDRLAWLEPGDFQNRVDEAKAAAERADLSYRRVHDAALKNAVSKEEDSKALSELRRAKAQLALAERSLENSVLRAPFDGEIADVPFDDYLMQSGSETIVVLQNTASIKIDVVVPETLAIQFNRFEISTNGMMRVRFDSAPEETYPVSYVECTSAADVETQTFKATFRLKPVPEDLNILPGMIATVILPGEAYRLRSTQKDGATVVSENAVGIDSADQAFVWELRGDGQDGAARSYTVHKVPVTIVLRDAGKAYVTGLRPGVRVASAGVSVLTEGRPVTLLEDLRR